MLARIAIFIIAAYRKATVFKARSCRFTPTCSEYAEQAVLKHGFRGIFIALMRILRCNQFFKGGHDPVK